MREGGERKGGRKGGKKGGKEGERERERERERVSLPDQPQFLLDMIFGSNHSLLVDISIFALVECQLEDILNARPRMSVEHKV